MFVDSADFGVWNHNHGLGIFSPKHDFIFEFKGFNVFFSYCLEMIGKQNKTNSGRGLLSEMLQTVKKKSREIIIKC